MPHTSHISAILIAFASYSFKAFSIAFLSAGGLPPLRPLALFLAAMYEKNGMPFEKVVKMVIKTRFVRPKIRKYQTENVYEYAVKQENLNKEVNRIVSKE